MWFCLQTTIAKDLPSSQDSSVDITSPILNCHVELFMPFDTGWPSHQRSSKHYDVLPVLYLTTIVSTVSRSVG